jgi:hypothetical protein
MANDARDERVGLNEAVFREVNERIENLTEKFDLRGSPLDLVCECADSTCIERITMRHSEYEEVRSDARQFVVSPGHVDEAIEAVVAQRPGYYVVRKRDPQAVAVAEATDRRS